MTNKELAQHFRQLGQLMELHGENPFKIRSYQSAYRNLRAYEQPLSELSAEEISSIKGVGKAISAKIQELLESGQMATLEKYRSKTPDGIQEMLNIKGFGAKKIMAVWEGLGVESVGELLYAVNENRLVELKGFGAKTQEELRKKLEYYQKSKNRFHYAAIEREAADLLRAVQEALPDVPVETCGPLRRKAVVIDELDILVGQPDAAQILSEKGVIEGLEVAGGAFEATTATEAAVPVKVHTCTRASFGSKLFERTAGEEFLEAVEAYAPAKDWASQTGEAAVFNILKLPYIQPELREQSWALDRARDNNLPDLITEEDIKGVVHAHTTYSDGANTLREMAEHAKAQGFAYLGLTDHSKSAFYANGLKTDRVFAQMEEVDALNQELAPFRIFKGIESDILNDGALDYEEDVLKAFDFIIARCTATCAWMRTRLHSGSLLRSRTPTPRCWATPTGRLLLSRRVTPSIIKRYWTLALPTACVWKSMRTPTGLTWTGPGCLMHWKKARNEKKITHHF